MIIYVLAMAIAALGAILLAILFMRIRAVDKDLKLSRHRSTETSLADLLNYAAVVDDGVIVGKNGSFMASWLYMGDDNASATDEQREMVSFRINQALVKMGNGWMLHVDAARRPAPKYSERGSSYFPDAITEAIDEERRRLFEGMGTMYEGNFVITLTYFPPMLAQRKFVEMMFDDDTKTVGSKASTRGLIEAFKREVDNVESRLSAAVKLVRLRGNKVTAEDGHVSTHDDMLRWLQFCITGLNHPVQLPNNPMYIDSLIGGQEMWGGVVPKIGRKFIQVVAIDGFPMESHPGILSALGELASEYRWSTRFIFLDGHEAIRDLEKYRKKWRQKVRGFFDQLFNTNRGPVDQDAQAMVQDAEEAIAEVNSGFIAQGYYTSTVVLMDEDRAALEISARQIEKAVNGLGFTARIETINTMDAYLGSLPGHGVENVRRPLINTMNLADLLPTSTIWAGENFAPSPTYRPNSPPLMQGVTHGATPFRFNLHVRDLGHTFIFGPTRAGKSTLLSLIAAQLRRYEGMAIFAFDKGLSMYPLAAAIHAATKGASGLHFDVAGDDDKLSFAPLQYLESRSDRAWAMEWIDTCLALNGLATTPGQRSEIARTVLQMKADETHTISGFVSLVQDAKIREAMEVYTADGAMGHLLDADSDGLSLSDFTVFEIATLMNLGQKFGLPVLLYLFRRIETSLKGQPAAIILDLAWLILGHPVFKEKIREWLMTMAKANCIVIMATQGLSDAANSGILDVIMESTASRVFLPNPSARDEDASALYGRMGLNKRQISILAEAIPKRHYYYVSEKGRRLFDLALGPLTLALIGATDKESLLAMKTLAAKHGHDWIHIWLANRNLRLDDYMGVPA